MAVELHLPDLPEVPLSVGVDPARPERRRRRRGRWRDVLANYLPLLLMLAIALASWWLVKSAPKAPADDIARPARSAPDYTMQRFSVERFDATGRLKARIEGASLLHFPATDQIEILDVRIQAYSPQGRLTTARAQRALTDGAATRIDLQGQAEIVGQADGGQPVLIRANALLLLLDDERVTTDSPVVVEVGPNRVQADGLDYSRRDQLLQFKGRMRAVLQPQKAS